MSSHPELPVFRPWPRLIVIFILLCLPFALRFDLGLGAPESLAGPASLGAQVVTGEWGGALVRRVLVSPFKLAMALAGVAVLIFAVLQLAALAADQAAAVSDRRRFSAAGRVLRWLAGHGGVHPMEDHLHAVAAWGGDASLSPLRLGVTAFPMVGFIGTVIGLSAAIEGLPEAIGDAGKLSPVLDSLHVAFDTTLLGLIGALVCVAGVRLAEARIDALARVA